MPRLTLDGHVPRGTTGTAEAGRPVFGSGALSSFDDDPLEALERAARELVTKFPVELLRRGS